MVNYPKLIVLLTGIFLSGHVHGQLTVNNTPTPTQLVINNLLGTGVTASNISYTGDPLAKGTFNGVASNIGINQGIILTTGNIFMAPGPNSSGSAGNNNGTPGDPDLAVLAGTITLNATILEFDFAVASDSVKFNYVFASEEYNEYVCSPFNDVFAFFLSGPGIAGIQNLALIPGTNIPVSINRVNNGTVGTFGNITNPTCTLSNSQYFVDNSNPPGNTVEFDGFTTVLTARSQVRPCDTYHIKMAVADAADGVYDSGVFLQKNSFSSFGMISIFANGNPQNKGPVYICPGGSVLLSSFTASNYTWSTGATTQSITVTQPGTYSMYVSNGTCFAWSNPIQVILVQPTAVITPAGPTTFCIGDSVTLNANAGSAWLWSTGATTKSINTSAAGNYTVQVTDTFGCNAVSLPVTVVVNTSSVSIAASGPTTFCIGDSVSLTASASASYLWSNGATTQSISVLQPGNYSVSVNATIGCPAAAGPVPVIVNSASASITPSGNTTFCVGDSVILTANASSGYIWSNGATTQSIIVNNAGTYSVTITDGNACKASDGPVPVIVNSTTAAITPLGPTTFCSGNNVILQANPGTAYLWSTGATTQAIPVTTTGSFSVTVTDPNTCKATSTPVSTIVSVPQASATLTGPSTICPGANTAINSSAGTAWLWSTGATTQSVTVNAAGAYSVSVTDTIGCIANSNIINVAMSQPTAVITPLGPTTFCVGSTVTLSANPSSAYFWTNGATTQTITVSTAGNYSVTTTDPFGCLATSTPVSIVVNTAVANITPMGPVHFCAGASVVLQANTGSAYTWSNGASTQSITVGSTGTFTVTVTNTNTCIATSTPVSTLASIPLATASITGPSTICPGASANLTSSSGTAWLWSNGATTQSVSVNTAGPYSVNITDTLGCVAPSNVVTIAISQPVAVITPQGPTIFCLGDSVVLQANSGSAWSWSTGATTQLITVTAAGNYSVVVTDLFGCPETSLPVSTTVNTASASVTPLGSTIICPGFSVDLQANAGLSYVWSNGATTQTITVGQAGNYMVNVVNMNGCSAFSTPVPVMVSIPVATITPMGPTDLCPWDSVILSANPGLAYLWSTGETSRNIVVNQAGTFTVMVTSTDGCDTLSDPVSVQIFPPFAMATAMGPTDLCPGESVVLTANPGSAWWWSNGATTQNITVSSGGNYAVTVANQIGCKEVSNIISVTELPASASITAMGPTTFCPGDSVSLMASAGTAFLWSTGASTQSISVQNNLVVSVQVVNFNGCRATSSPMTIALAPHPVVSFSALPPAGCAPLKVALMNSTTGVDAGTLYTWDLGNGLSSSGMNPVTLYPDPGLYTVSLHVINSFGCEDSLTQPDMILVSDKPEADFTFTPDAPMLFNSTLTFTDQSLTASQWRWEFGDNKFSVEQSPVHTYEQAGTFPVTLYIQNIYGCTDRITKEIFVTPFYMPNAFTPNGDGKNDGFYSRMFDMNVAAYDLRIFNRWGQTVFQTADPSLQWNGKDMNHEPAHQGVYVYKLVITSHNKKEHIFRGSVSLIR